jgi:hypothetical protein
MDASRPPWLWITHYSLFHRHGTVFWSVFHHQWTTNFSLRKMRYWRGPNSNYSVQNTWEFETFKALQVLCMQWFLMHWISDFCGILNQYNNIMHSKVFGARMDAFCLIQIKNKWNIALITRQVPGRKMANFFWIFWCFMISWRVLRHSERLTHCCCYTVKRKRPHLKLGNKTELYNIATALCNSSCDEKRQDWTRLCNWPTALCNRQAALCNKATWLCNKKTLLLCNMQPEINLKADLQPEN